MAGHDLMSKMMLVILISLLCSMCNPVHIPVPSDNWCFHNSGNQTIFPHTDPKVLFQTYGYSDRGIPRDLSIARVHLLHEETVLHVVTHLKEFKMANKGKHGKLYHGEIRWSKEKVLIKKLNDGDFQHILNEATITSYLAPSRYVPAVYGLLPTGPHYDDLSLVVQLIQNSSNLFDLLGKGSLISECQWLSISEQIAAALLYVHKAYVLFNDLHESNILIQWRGSNPHVYIVDYGHAMFRQTESFADTPEWERADSVFLAPEVWYDITSPASDVYSLGDMLLSIADFVKYHPFHDIAHRCHEEIVKDRINLTDAKDMLARMFQRRCPRENGTKFDDVITKEIEEAENVRNLALNFTLRMKKDKPLMAPIPMISSDHIELKYSFERWMNSKYVIYKIANYRAINSEVVVKEFVGGSFEEIRHEALINSMMNDTGYVLAFHGLLSRYSRLTDFRIVQEFVDDLDVLSHVFSDIKTKDINFKTLLAVELSIAVATFHQRGIVINNILPRNILIPSERNPLVKFIDLRECTENNEVYFGEVDDEFSCPSIERRRIVTYATDVYSLSTILQNIFESYSDFTITDILNRGTHSNPSRRPSAEAIHSFFAKRILTCSRM